MSLFFRKTRNHNQTNILFNNWLDRILKQDIPNDIKAFNFNIYEGRKNTYDIELIGSDEFTEEDDDWACSDYFTTKDNMYIIKRVERIIDWDEGLKYIKDLVTRYLNNGKYARILRDALAVTVGFVDGDLEIIYTKEKKCINI